jgi:hypothetical protein
MIIQNEKKRNLKSTKKIQKKKLQESAMTSRSINKLNCPSKRHRLCECVEKQDPIVCYIQETNFNSKYIQSESGRIENTITSKLISKAETILISNKADIKTKLVRRGIGHYILKRYSNCEYICFETFVYPMS